MKKLCFLFILFVLITNNLFSQDYFSNDSFEKNKNRVVLLFPTVGGLENFIYLIDNRIIDIPKLELIGLYHANESYDYNKSVEFLEENEYPYIHLHKVEGDLEPGNLYKKNACSDEFYKIFKNSNAILFQGGWDIPPVVYGGKTNLLTSIVTPDRHYFDVSLLFHLLGGKQNPEFKPYIEEKPDYIIFAFCLGMQSLNVATGGTLFQDIPSEVYGQINVEDVLDSGSEQMHRNYWRNLSADDSLTGGHLHHIRIVENKFFMNELKLKTDDFPLIYSSHHQSVKNLGKGLEITANSMDGKIIEAISHKKFKNVVAVQFHPEKSGLFNPEKKYKITPEDSEPVSLYDILEEKDKTNFHRKFWNHFSKLVKE